MACTPMPHAKANAKQGRDGFGIHWTRATNTLLLDVVICSAVNESERQEQQDVKHQGKHAKTIVARRRRDKNNQYRFAGCANLVQEYDAAI